MMVADAHSYTPTQRKILAVLSDGRPHSREELFACLPDDLGSVSNVRAHLSILRRKLRGRLIVCELHGRAAFYRLAEASAYGRKRRR
jgi:DNA-binding CsgD family transcriptional regulator